MTRGLKGLLLAASSAAATAVVLSVGLPYALYEYGLSTASIRPEASSERVLESRVAEEWQAVERSEEIDVHRMDPWTPIWRLFIGPEVLPERPGERACTYLAGVDVHESSGRMPNWKRHIATYSISVWISRQWTPEQIAREIALLEERRQRQPRASREMGEESDS